MLETPVYSISGLGSGVPTLSVISPVLAYRHSRAACPCRQSRRRSPAACPCRQSRRRRSRAGCPCRQSHRRSRLKLLLTIILFLIHRNHIVNVLDYSPKENLKPRLWGNARLSGRSTECHTRWQTVEVRVSFMIL